MYKRYALQLLYIATEKTGSLETAKEMVQEVFLSVYEQKDTLHTVNQLKAYLTTILKYKVFNFYRHQLVQEKYLDYLSENAGVPERNNVSQLLENKELKEMIRNNIDQLPPKCREVFKLSREEHYSYKQIAEHLQISENTVDQHIRKALKLLRESIGRYKEIAISIGSLIIPCYFM